MCCFVTGHKDMYFLGGKIVFSAFNARITNQIYSRTAGAILFLPPKIFDFK